MRFIPLVAAIMATFASAAPAAEDAELDSRQAQQLGTFYVTDFNYACTQICRWEFNVTVGPSFRNHPGFNRKIRCSGTLNRQNFDDDSCRDINTDNPDQSVEAYITRDTQRLRLQYNVDYDNRNQEYWYTGYRKVKASSFGLDFNVRERNVRAVG